MSHLGLISSETKSSGKEAMAVWRGENEPLLLLLLSAFFLFFLLSVTFFVCCFFVCCFFVC